MPGVYMFKFHVYSPVTLLLFSCLFGCTIRAQENTTCQLCYSTTACTTDGDCKLCPSTCPEGFYWSPDVDCAPVTTSTLTSTSTPLATGNATNATTPGVSSAAGIITSPGTNLSTSTQPTTVINNITCKKCSVTNCISCSNNISCDNCTTGYKLTANSSCELTKDKETDNSALIGGVVGGILGGLVLIGIIVFVIIWWRRRRQTEGMNSSTVEQQQPQEQAPKRPHEQPKQLPKLNDDVVNMHDRILRYTRDPTSKRLTTASSPEEEELEQLPAAPLPPNKTYDRVGSSQNYSTSYSEFKGQSPQDHHHHSPPPGEEESEDIYANQQAIVQAQDEADGLYANTQTLKLDRKQLKAQSHGSVSRSGSRAKKNDETQQAAEEKVDDACAEQEDVYTNDNTELIADDDDKETQEIYLNENLEEDDIYLNVSK